MENVEKRKWQIPESAPDPEPQIIMGSLMGPMSHPSKLHVIPSCSFCLILLTNENNPKMMKSY